VGRLFQTWQDLGSFLCSGLFIEMFHYTILCNQMRKFALVRNTQRFRISLLQFYETSCPFTADANPMMTANQQ
jgi:hypothetical protein